MTEKSGRYPWRDDIYNIIGYVELLMREFDITTDDMRKILDILDNAGKSRDAKKQA